MLNNDTPAQQRIALQIPKFSQIPAKILKQINPDMYDHYQKNFNQLTYHLLTGNALLRAERNESLAEALDAVFNFGVIYGVGLIQKTVSEASEQKGGDGSARETKGQQEQN
jgi:hypothetical protein